MRPPFNRSQFPGADCSFPPHGLNHIPHPPGSVLPVNWHYPLRPQLEPLGNRWPHFLPESSGFGMHFPQQEFGEQSWSGSSRFPGSPIVSYGQERFYPPLEQFPAMEHLSQPMERLPPPMVRFPPPMERFPPPMGRFPPPMDRFPPPQERFPGPIGSTERFPPSMNQFYPPIQRFLPPVDGFPRSPRPCFHGVAMEQFHSPLMDCIPRLQREHLARPPMEGLPRPPMEGLPRPPIEGFSTPPIDGYSRPRLEGFPRPPLTRLALPHCSVERFPPPLCSVTGFRSSDPSTSVPWNTSKDSYHGELQSSDDVNTKHASSSPVNKERVKGRSKCPSEKRSSKLHSRVKNVSLKRYKPSQRRSSSTESKVHSLLKVNNIRCSQSYSISRRIPAKSSDKNLFMNSPRHSKEGVRIDPSSRTMCYSSPRSTRKYDFPDSDSHTSRNSSNIPRVSTGASSSHGSAKSWGNSPAVLPEATPHVHYDDDEKDLEEELKEEISMWSRCSPSDLHYRRNVENSMIVEATPKLITLLDRFEEEILIKAATERSAKPTCFPSSRKLKLTSHYLQESSDIDGIFSDDESGGNERNAVYELERKRKHPSRLHEELWYNDVGEMNDGPLCRCSMKAKRSGIRHGLYPGEDYLKECDPHSNNADRLFHYRITMSPHTNFLTKAPTIIQYDSHEFIFEGFSMLSHYKLPKLPLCKVIRFNIEYTIHFMEEKLPENFTIRGVDIFCDYLYREILELVDLDLRAHTDPTGCRRFHFFPRFARALEENGKEILSMNEVLSYLLGNFKPLVEEADLPRLLELNQHEWQNFADEIKGMIVTYPGKKPCSLRVDQLDRDLTTPNTDRYPEIVHFGIRPLQLSYAGNPNYQKAWREYVKFRHLLANKPKVGYQDRHKLLQKEIRLQEMRTKSNLKRDVTIVVSSKGFYRTGIMCDIVQHAMLLPVLVCHLRFHNALDILEENIGHVFHDRYLLQLALTHPSYRENFGTNPDHARNSLTNCGIRQPEYGDRRIHYMNTRKRGINTLINIMSRFGKHVETISNINHNERLEFLGDAVVEFLTSIHLFHLFPDIEEGGLATYRAAIVQNQHLAVLAKKLQLEKFMLYAHGSDLCHDLELRHAMANCFEALMGALFLDGGVDAADRVFSQTLFSDDLLDVWTNYPAHPIQEQEPDGDRHWIKLVPRLSKMTKFEEEIGVTFKHIRLLVRAFTHRSVGYNHLTLGSNQRMEFLGDTVLQLVASEYLYKFFPEHHEGHLSLLRSSLVNNRTQSVVCDDLGMVNYADYAYPKGELKIKDRADLLEAFLGALYVDKGLEYCQIFCQVCFFPRLQDFIMNQDWNDPKSKLQQCCLTLRTMDGGEPDIPIYKVIESKGPTNTRIFTVAVYFRGKRLAKGSGHSIQQAEMAAASKALESSKADLFPQLNHQRRVIERSLKKQRQSQREKS